MCAPVNSTWDFRTGEDDFFHLYSFLLGGEIVSADKKGQSGLLTNETQLDGLGTSR